MISVLIICSLLIPNRGAETPKISTSTEAYFREMKGIHVYQQTVPILYSMNISINHDSAKLREQIELIRKKDPFYHTTLHNKLDQIEMVVQNIDVIEELRINILNEFEMPEGKDVNGYEKKMQFIGDTLQWCCEEMTTRDGREMLQNEKGIKNAYENIKDEILEKHQGLLNVTTDLKNVATGASKQMEDIYTEMRKIEQGLKSEVEIEAYINRAKELLSRTMIGLMTMTTTMTKILQIFLSCKNNHIPASVVNKDIFKKGLEKMKKEVAKNGYELMLGDDKLHSYYHLKIVTCTTIQDTIEIEIQIPIKPKNTMYTLFEYIPIYFKTKDNQLCTWEQEPAMLIHEQNTRTVRIASGADRDLCNKKEPLCRIPQGRVTASQVACASALFTQETYERLIKSCVLTCAPNHNITIIKEIGKERFAITNAKKRVRILNIQSQDIYWKDLSNEWPGTIIVTVPCKYEIDQEKDDGTLETIIPRGMPCPKTDKRIEIQHHLPIIWTNIRDVNNFDQEQSFHFRDFKTGFNANWSKTVHYYTTVIPIQEIEAKLGDIKLSIPPFAVREMWNWINIMLITWCCLLTIVVFLMGMFIGESVFKTIAEIKLLLVKSAHNLDEIGENL